MLIFFKRAGKANFAIEKKLFVYDSGKFDPSVDSGIRATIFGATGSICI